MIIRGTTPPIRFSFTEVDPQAMTEVFLTIRQNSILIEKDLSEAVVTQDAILWELTQSETLSLEDGWNAKVQCRYKFASGAAGASRIYEEPVYGVLKEGEI